MFNLAGTAVALDRKSGCLRETGASPIPGYRLLSPLGRGGFGDVWKCEAPGGIHKAIKFIRGQCDVTGAHQPQAAQEHKALQLVVGVRHPFILSLDRIEVADGELLIVMELADRTLFDLLKAYQQAGEPGIPRDELLGYMAEAAEALDLMNHEHGLLHLDIKPGNLFLCSGHVKVADFGLVTDLMRMNDGSQTVTQVSDQLTGITPLYVSPETLQGKIHKNSDQYSLAIVYQELLTGALPFSGKNPRQLAMQHMMAEPNLSTLPPADRPIIARALSKDPTKRYNSCLAFLQSLISGEVDPPSVPRTDRSSSRLIRKLQGLDTAKEINLASTDFSSHELPPGLMPVDVPVDTGHRSTPAPTVPRQPVLNDPLSAPLRLNLTSPHTSGTDQDQLPGFTFLECVARSPLGELWRVATPDDEPALAKIVTGFDGLPHDEEEKAVNFLRSIKHPGLISYEIVRTGPGRLCMLSAPLDMTLWDHFQLYKSKRIQGIPRQELLPILRQAAQTLDDLFQRFELLHLAINPRSIVCPPEHSALLAEFGLAHVLWVPSGNQVSQLNARYAAPELDEGVVHRGSDIFSLALVYQEMSVGVHPLRTQALRTGTRPPGRAAAPPRALTPNLDALHPSERAVLARALDPDPDQRFHSCLELIDALEQTVVGASTASRPKPQAAPNPRPPSVELAPLAAPVVQTTQAVAQIISTITSAWPTETINGVRYIHRQGELLHHRCGAMLVAGMAKAKIDGFRLAIGGELVRADDTVFVYRVPRTAKSFWKSLRPLPTGVEVTVHIVRPQIREALLCDVTIQVRPYGVSDVNQADELLRETGPRIVETLRKFLQASNERRVHERFEYNVPIKVHLIQDQAGRSTAISCQGKDISNSGLAFYCPGDVRGVQLVKAELIVPKQQDPFIVRAQVIRCDRHLQGGWYEIGTRFLFEDDPRRRRT
jgi:serine/threonine protein kinase